MSEFVSEVTALAFGGKGVVRCEGKVVFVPFTAPGELVRGQVVKQHKNFAEGELLEVIQPSQERVSASCPYFGRCGGCQLQHLSYEEQLRQKQRFVMDALQRVGKINLENPIPIQGAEAVWAYRRHVHLTLKIVNGCYQAGYIGVDGTTHLPVAECPIFLKVSLEWLRLVQDLTPVEGEAHIGVYKNGDRFILGYDFEKAVPPNMQAVARRHLNDHPSIQGIAVQAGSRRQQWGDIEGKFVLNGLQMTFSPFAFVQNHPEQSARIYRQIVELAGKSVLDLYCGLGSTSLLLAQKGAQVVGVETSPEAIRLAKINAFQNHLEAKFVCGDVEKKLGGLLKESWETVLVNPPRTGLDPKAFKTLLQARPKQIIYLSCMPATLARDLAQAQAAGYRIGFCQAYDMFPQTTHVETLVEMRLAGGK